MIERNFLEQHKETADGNLCYIDYKRKLLKYLHFAFWKLSDTTNNNCEKVN